jgi:Flp pilus assembly protein TadD
LALVALVTVLAFPYLSVRKVSVASDISSRNPAAALSDLSQAASLNPLSAVPGRMAGTIALQNAQYPVAEQRFRQAIDREPGGWFAYFGDGLAASALGDSSRAQRDFSRAAAINRQEPAVKTALARVNSLHPLPPAAALRLLSQSS